MSEYQRMVVYLYSYIEGRKERNIGYARLEKRNGQIKILIQVKGLCSEKPYKVFLVAKEKENYKKYIWGNFIRRGNTGEFRGATLAENILGKEISFSDAKGIIIEGIGLMAGFWEDIEVDLEKIPEAELEIIKSSKEVSEKGIEIMEVLEEPEKSKLEEETPEEEKEGVLESVETQETNPQIKRVEGKNWWKNLWGKVGNVEKIDFSDEKEGDLLKIRLEDIKYLPADCWICRNNSFLLHNYYYFDFLVIIHNDIGEYYLGVPGIMNSEELTVADMFGFGLGKKIGQEPRIRGYWLKLIDKD